MKPTDKEPNHYPNQKTKELFSAILKLKNLPEATKFFRDLLTIGEIGEFSDRWQMAKLLYEGKTYAEVAKLTKSSTTTVSRVSHWLHHGMGGYKLILERIKKKK